MEREQLESITLHAKQLLESNHSDAIQSFLQGASQSILEALDQCGPLSLGQLYEVNSRYSHQVVEMVGKLLFLYLFGVKSTS